MSLTSWGAGPCLQEPSSIEKVAEVDTHIGVAMSGLTADARTLIEHARVETQVPPLSPAQALLLHGLHEFAAPQALLQRAALALKKGCSSSHAGEHWMKLACAPA